VKSVILIISTELPRNASMRPNVGGIGLTMMWSTHDMIFMVFGKIGIAGAPNRNIQQNFKVLQNKRSFTKQNIPSNKKISHKIHIFQNFNVSIIFS